MRGRKKTRFTQEFRQEAVRLVLEHGYTQAEAGKRLGISSKNLSRWIKEQASGKTSSLSVKQKLTAEQEELQALRKENKRLKLEREILKKAAVFFANAPD